jgi:predicted metal-dependent peptidase
MAQLTPERMISKALIKLTTNDPFFGCVAMRLNVEPVTDAFVEQFEKERGFEFKMATDGKVIKYAPKWVANQQLNDLVGTLAHEAAHVALKHNIRRGERDPMKWNIACDLAINGHLIDQGYSIPDFDETAKDKAKQYMDMSAEKIYGMIPDGPKSGQNKPGQNPPPCPPSGQGGQATPKQGKGKGKGNGKGKGQPDSNQPPPQQDQFQNAPPDAGGILDHPQSKPKNKNQQRELEEEADGQIEAAYNAAKMVGDVPGWMDRIVKGRRKVLNDYREMLRDWMEKSLYKGNYSWAVPNRRYMPMGFCLPGFAPEDDQPNFVFVMDTSGSIDEDDKTEFGSHINSVLEEFPASYTVIYCDTQVRGTQEVSFDDLPIELKVKGGGGTNFDDAMRVIKEQYVKSDNPPHGVIFFTDLATSSFGDDPGIPVLWLVHGSYANEKSEVPFGKVVKCMSKRDADEEMAQ